MAEKAGNVHGTRWWVDGHLYFFSFVEVRNEKYYQCLIANFVFLQRPFDQAAEECFKRKMELAVLNQKFAKQMVTLDYLLINRHSNEVFIE